MKTNLIKSKINTPWCNKGDVIEASEEYNAQLYPDVFSDVYRLLDGTEVSFGDTVWRITEKGYYKIIKSVLFSEAHTKSDSIEIFSSKSSAEKELERLLDESNKFIESDSLKQAIRKVREISNIKDIESLSLKDIKAKFELIDLILSNEQ